MLLGQKNVTHRKANKYKNSEVRQKNSGSGYVLRGGTVVCRWIRLLARLHGEYVANTAVGLLTKKLEDETVSQRMQRVRRARGKTVLEFDLYYDEPEQWSQEWVKITSYGQPTVRFPLPITGPVLPKNLTDISKFESLSKYFAPSTVMVLKALREWTDGKYNKEVGSDKTELDKLESVMAQIYNKTEARHSWYRQEYIARIGETRYAPGRYETLVAAHRPEVDKITFSVVGATNRKKGFDQNYKRDAWYYNKNLKTQLSLAQKQMFQQKANGGTQELISFLNAFKILANGISFFGPVLAVIGKIVSFVLQIIMFFIDESREYVFHVYENVSLGPTIKWVGPVTEIVKKFFGQETKILHNAFDKQKDVVNPVQFIKVENELNELFYSGLNSENGYESFNDVMVRNSWEDIDSIVRSTAAQPETPSVAKPASDLSSDTTGDWWKNLPEPKKGQFMYWIF